MTRFKIVRPKVIKANPAQLISEPVCGPSSVVGIRANARKQGLALDKAQATCACLGQHVCVSCCLVWGEDLYLEGGEFVTTQDATSAVKEVMGQQLRGGFPSLGMMCFTAVQSNVIKTDNIMPVGGP